jgi:hypothetical protein
MHFIRSSELQILLRTLVIVTLILFIFLAERSFHRAGVRGRLGRILEIIAAFITGIALRGLIIVIT